MRKPFVIFLILGVYIILQFAWWAYLIYEQSQVIIGAENGIPIPEDRRDHLRMIMSEGTVFLIIVGALMILAYRTYRRELSLVRNKDNFLMSVTHELRTPIAGMRLNMQTLQRKDLEEEQRQKLLKNAISDSERLQELSDRILLAARSEEDIKAVTSEEVDLSKLSTELISKCKHEFEPQRRINSHVRDGISAHIDGLAFGSILLNLVQNAVKYSPVDTEINIRLAKKENTIVLTVSDEGYGILDTDKKRVFEKFFRGGDESTRRAKGTGLGLYIVKRFVQRFNGVIKVSDNAPAGSIFEVILPTKKNG